MHIMEYAMSLGDVSINVDWHPVSRTKVNTAPEKLI